MRSFVSDSPKDDDAANPEGIVPVNPLELAKNESNVLNTRKYVIGKSARSKQKGIPTS